MIDLVEIQSCKDVSRFVAAAAAQRLLHGGNLADFVLQRRRCAYYSFHIYLISTDMRSRAKRLSERLYARPAFRANLHAASMELTGAAAEETSTMVWNCR